MAGSNGTPSLGPRTAQKLNVLMGTHVSPVPARAGSARSLRLTSRLVSPHGKAPVLCVRDLKTRWMALEERHLRLTSEHRPPPPDACAPAHV